MSCVRAIAGVSAVLVAGSLHAQSPQEYPNKPVMVVVAQTAGGPNDQETRLYLAKMQPLLGQPFVLDFRPGAGGVIGSNHVARSAADGYTLLQTAGAFTIIPALSATATYDVIKDFAAISLMSRKAAVVLANPAFPPRNFREYIDYARSNPGKINIGTAGPGSTVHLMGAWIHQATGTSVTYIPYKGVAPILPDLFTGRVDVTIVTTLVAGPLLKGGKVKALAVTDDKRSQMMPDVPTVAEQGVPGFSYTNWLGFLAPAATPPAVITRLNETFAKVAKMPDIVASMAEQGSTMAGGTPAEFRELLSTEYARWRKLAQDTGITL